jgi:hypothetical protein
VTEKELKLLRLALDPAAAPGEIENCAVMFVKSLRKRGVKAEELETKDVVVYRTWSSPNMQPSRPPKTKDWSEVTITWGKHKNKMLKQIPDDYLTWAANWIDSDDERKRKMSYLRMAIKKYLDI